jgi:hypothetical protein
MELNQARQHDIHPNPKTVPEGFLSEGCEEFAIVSGDDVGPDEALNQDVGIRIEHQPKKNRNSSWRTRMKGVSQV